MEAQGIVRPKAMRLKVGHKLILIYLVSLSLALSAVLITAESIISQQV